MRSALRERMPVTLMGVLALGLGLAMAQDRSGQDPPGRQALQAACSGCHDVDLIYQSKKTSAQWRETVAQMIARGAPVLAGERELIEEFLIANYNAEGGARTGTPAAAGPARAAPATGPEARGRQILQEACTVCHELDFVYQSRRTRSEWEETVGDMMGRGALLLEGERELLLEFLARHYGRPNATSVNTATAQQLMAAFGLTQSEADAVVSYREQRGVILGWEDLRKISGLDVRKLEAKRDSVTFY